MTASFPFWPTQYDGDAKMIQGGDPLPPPRRQMKPVHLQTLEEIQVRTQPTAPPCPALPPSRKKTPTIDPDVCLHFPPTPSLLLAGWQRSVPTSEPGDVSLHQAGAYPPRRGHQVHATRLRHGTRPPLSSERYRRATPRVRWVSLARGQRERGKEDRGSGGREDGRRARARGRRRGRRVQIRVRPAAAADGALRR